MPTDSKHKQKPHELDFGIPISVYSELDHYQTKVKRRNLVDLFLNNLNADEFISKHLYGQI